MRIEVERLPEYESIIEAFERAAGKDTKKGSILKEYIASGRLHSTWGWYLQLLGSGKADNDKNLSQKAAPYVLEIVSKFVRRKILENETLRNKVYTAICEAIKKAHELEEIRYNYMDNTYKYLPEIIDDMIYSYIDQGKMVCRELKMPICVFTHFIDVIVRNDNGSRLEDFLISQYKVVAACENSNELIGISVSYASETDNYGEVFLKALIIVWVRCHKINSASSRKTEKMLKRVLTECSKRGCNIIDCYIDIVLANKLQQDIEYGLLGNDIHYQKMIEELMELQTVSCEIKGDNLDELLKKGSEGRNSESPDYKYERLVFSVCSQCDIVMEDRAYLFQKRLLQKASEELLCRLQEKGLFGMGALRELINAEDKKTYLRAMPLLVMWKYGNESNASGQCANT